MVRHDHHRNQYTKNWDHLLGAEWPAFRSYLLFRKAFSQVPTIFSGVPGEEDVPNADIVTWNEADGSWTTWPNALSTARIQGAVFTTSYRYNCDWMWQNIKKPSSSPFFIYWCLPDLYIHRMAEEWVWVNWRDGKIMKFTRRKLLSQNVVINSTPVCG